MKENDNKGRRNINQPSASATQCLKSSAQQGKRFMLAHKLRGFISTLSNPVALGL